ncbi:MAG: PP2C family protein-serine/threonine phosphatase [Terriglobales bacterium]
MATSRHRILKPAVFVPNPHPASASRQGRSEALPEVGPMEVQVAALEQERRELHQQLLEAGHIQRRLSGPRLLRRGSFDIASEVFPVRHLAGDFVTTMDFGDKVWIAVGDIAGKGIAAAMWFTYLVSMIRCHLSSHTEAAEVMSAVNQDMCALRPSPPISTMILLRLDASCGRIEYCNAGHPPALLLGSNRELRRLDAGGPILGVVNGASFKSAEVTIAPGEVLLACSDGVLEHANRSEEEFGEARLAQAARDHAGEPAESVLFSLLAALQDFSEGARPQDDVSLLVVRAAESKRR